MMRVYRCGVHNRIIASLTSQVMARFDHFYQFVVCLLVCLSLTFSRRQLFFFFMLSFVINAFSGHNK